MTAVINGARRAALLVHSMQEADRAWLLAQLAPDEREPLAVMLAELQALGIPAEPELLRLAAEPMPDAPVTTRLDASVAAGGGDSELPVEALRRADPQRIADVVRDEPPALIADLLMIGNWPWREAMVASLPAVKRRQVEESLSGRGPCAAKLGERLVALLLLHVRNAGDRDVVCPPVPSGTAIRRETALPERLADAWRRLFRKAEGI